MWGSWDMISYCVCLWSRVMAAPCRPLLLQSTLPFAAPPPPLTCSFPPHPHGETEHSPLTPTLWLEKGRHKMKDGATGTSRIPPLKRLCPSPHLSLPPDPVPIQRHLPQPIFARRTTSSHMRAVNPFYTMGNTHRVTVWTTYEHLI